MLTVVAWALLIILTVQQALDVISTTLTLSKGRGHEGNRLIAEWMKISGRWWWTIKLPITAAPWAMFYFYGAEPQLIAIVALLVFIYLYVLINNYQIAWRH